MQPLDLTFYGPLKNAFNRECDLYLKSRVFEKITHYDLAEIFNRAYIKVATMDKGISGFQAAGIWPINPEKFSEDDFCPIPENNITIHAQVDLNESTEGNNKAETSFNAHQAKSQLPRQDPETSDDTKTIENSSRHLEPQPGPSRDCFINEDSPLRTKLEELAPIPRPVFKTSNKSRAKKHSEILTSTPLKEQLEAAQEKKAQRGIKAKEKEQKKKRDRLDIKEENHKRKLPTNKKKPKSIIKKPSHIRNLHLGDESETSSSYDENMICDDNEDDDVDPTNKDICLVCGEFGQDGEMWYRCVHCSNWSHAECSGWDSADEYTCDLCISKNKKLKEH